MALRLNGSTSGYVELDAPAVAGTTALTLPATAGTVATQAYADTAGATLGGLVHIATESFSAASTASVNNCFTSAYENYFFSLEITNTSAAMNILMRLRAAGSDDSSANYFRNIILVSNGSLSGGRTTSATSWEIVNIGSGQRTIITGNIFAPQLAEKTFSQQASGPNADAGAGAVRYALTGFDHSPATAYDGFSLLTSTGNITGIVRVYGYKNGA